eukprot:203725_1
MLKVFSADSGRRFDVQFGHTDSVAGLSQSLAVQTNVNTHDQILIAHNGIRLEPEQKLDHYKLNQESLVFLFNRQNLSGKAPPRMFMELTPTKFNESSFSVDPFDSPDDSLTQFSRLFKRHVDEAAWFCESGENHIGAFGQCIGEQRVQVRALSAVVCNLKAHSKHLASNFSNFSEAFEKQEQQHRSLLDSFETNLEELRKHELHVALVTHTRSTLLDCVKEGSFRKWAGECEAHHQQLSEKVSELKLLEESIQTEVENEGQISCPVDFENLGAELAKCQSLRDKELACLEVLQKDLRSVSESVSEQAVVSNDVAQAFEMQSRQHNVTLNELRGLDDRLLEIGNLFRESQISLCAFFYERLHSVSKLQSRMRDLENKLSLFDEAMRAKDQMFEKFREVENIPSAYYACLAEICRRRAFGKLYVAEIATSAARLTSWRDGEVIYRESFHKQFGKSIPTMLAKALEDQPAYCDIQTREFDKNLPEVDSYTLPDGTEKFSDFSLPVTKEESDSKHERTVDVKGSVLLPGRTWQDDNSVTAPLDSEEKLRLENSFLRAELSLKSMSSSFLGLSKCIVEHSPDRTDRQLLELTVEAKKLSREAEESQIRERLTHSDHIDKLEEKVAELKAELESLTESNRLLSGECEGLRSQKESFETQLKENRDHSLEQTRLLSDSEHKWTQTSEQHIAVLQEQWAQDSEMRISELQHEWAMESEKNVAVLKKDWEEESEKRMSASLQSSKVECDHRISDLEKQTEQRIMEQTEKLAEDSDERRQKLVAVWNEKLIDQMRRLDSEWKRKMANEVERLTSSSSENMTELETLRAENISRKKEFESLREESDKNVVQMEAKEAELSGLKKRLNEMESELNSSMDGEVWQRFAQARICYQMFEIGNIALFMKNERDHYEAFNDHLPHRFLSSESKQIIFSDGRTDEEVPFILGRIVLMTNREATEDDNPYGLKIGDEFWELLVETVGDR